MRKLLCLMLSLLLLFSAAAADEDNWVDSDPIYYIYSIENLLFNTHNVTLTGEAHFSLNGDWFKTANAVYRQDGENSYWDYRLKAPGPFADVRENGYTVVANGQSFFVMESYPSPGTYKSGADTARDTVLRESVQTQSMFLVLEHLAKNAYTILDNNSFTVSADANRNETMHIRLDENTPDLVNLSLTLFWQYTARRFFEVDTEQIDEFLLEQTQDYSTVSRRLLATARGLSVKSADFTVKMDGRELLQQIAGSASVSLNTVSGEENLLDIVFRLDVTDRDSTKVGEFTPEDYGVVPFHEDEPVTPMNEERMDLLESLSTHADFSWDKAGYKDEMDRFCSGSARQVGEYFFMKREADIGSEYLLTVTDPLGNLIELRHSDGFDAEQILMPYADEQLVRDSLDKARTFLNLRYPSAAARMGEMKLSWWREKDGRVDFCFEQDPVPETDTVTIIVRALPEWHIESVVCGDNG